LRQPLLRKGPRQTAAAHRQRRRGGADLKHLAAGDHGLDLLRMIFSENWFPLFGIMR
jgi:hypothetical protein